MATEQEDVAEGQDAEDESLQPGEVEIELGGEESSDEEAQEQKPAAETTPEERKTRRERREEHERKRIADQVREQVEAASARIRQEYEQRSRQPEQQRTEPKQEQSGDTKVIQDLRKQGARLARLIKDPETPEDEVKELAAELQGIQEQIVGEVARRSMPKPDPSDDPRLEILQAEFGEFYDPANLKLLEYARTKGAIIARSNPHLSPFAVARRSFIESRADIERLRAKQKVSPEQASKYGSSTSTGGPRESNGASGGTVRLSKNQRDLALYTYSDKPNWSEEKKIKTWAEKQKKLNLL